MGGGVFRKCQTLAIDYQQFAETYLQFYYEIPQQHFTDPQEHVLVEKNNEQFVHYLSKPANTATRSFLL